MLNKARVWVNIILINSTIKDSVPGLVGRLTLRRQGAKTNQGISMIFIFLFFANPYILYPMGCTPLVYQLTVENREYKVLNVCALKFEETGSFDSFLREHRTVLNDANRFSRIIVIDKLRNDTLFNHGTIFCTSIRLSGNKILCFSDISCYNDYHIVAYNIKGDVLFKKDVNPIGIFLNSFDFGEASLKNGSLFHYLDSINLIVKLDSGYWIDLSSSDFKFDVRKGLIDSIKSKAIFIYNPEFPTVSAFGMYMSWYSKSRLKFKMRWKHEQLIRLKYLDSNLKWRYIRTVTKSIDH